MKNALITQSKTRCYSSLILKQNRTISCDLWPSSLMSIHLWPIFPQRVWGSLCQLPSGKGRAHPGPVPSSLQPVISIFLLDSVQQHKLGRSLTSNWQSSKWEVMFGAASPCWRAPVGVVLKHSTEKKDSAIWDSGQMLQTSIPLDTKSVNEI